jgi:hypothetical protein
VVIALRAIILSGRIPQKSFVDYRYSDCRAKTVPLTGSGCKLSSRRLWLPTLDAASYHGHARGFSIDHGTAYGLMDERINSKSSDFAGYG